MIPLPRPRLIEAPSLSRRTSDRVFLKLESDMPTGSFKVRGALHALSVNAGRRAIAEVVASSTGNHGAAVAWAAQRLGIRATIFLPRGPNPVKRDSIVRLGARVVEHGCDLAEACDGATAHASRTGAFFLNDATDPELPEGPAAIADEVIADLPDVDALYVPVGDTALIRGVGARARVLKPSVRIVGVQAEAAPSYYHSWRAGRATPSATADTIADGLATRTPIEENVQAIRTLVHDMRLVSEDAMIAAVGRLLLDERVVAEPSAAATVAALLAESRSDRPRHVVLLITGCNIAPDLLRTAIATA